MVVYVYRDGYRSTGGKREEEGGQDARSLPLEEGVRDLLS